MEYRPNCYDFTIYCIHITTAVFCLILSLVQIVFCNKTNIICYASVVIEMWVSLMTIRINGFQTNEEFKNHMTAYSIIILLLGILTMINMGLLYFSDIEFYYQLLIYMNSFIYLCSMVKVRNIVINHSEFAPLLKV